MKGDLTTANADASWLQRFFVREDTVYDRYESVYQAKTAFEKAVYLLLYLLPGIIAFICMNVEPVFRAQLANTRLSARYLQYAWVLMITFRLDRRGLFLVLPVYFGLFALISLPYVKFVAPVIESWTKSISLFRIPGYSIFQDTPEAMYSFPAVAFCSLASATFWVRSCTSGVA